MANKAMKSLTMTPDGVDVAPGELGVGEVDVSDVDTAAYLARAQEAFNAARQRAARTPRGVGYFLKPKGFEDWDFHRVGARHDPRDPGVRYQHQAAMAKHQAMKLSGWIDAPPGTKWVTGAGVEDSTTGIFVCLPRVYADQFRAEKLAAAKATIAAAKKVALPEDDRVQIDEIVHATRSFSVPIKE